MKRAVNNYFLVGLFTIVVTVLTIYLLAQMTGRNTDADNYYSRYTNVTGLGYGTPVYYEGYRIGQIESIEPQFEKQNLSFKVTFSIMHNWKIPVDSQAQIQSSGLLSDMSININAGQADDYHKPGDEILGLPPSDLMAQLGKVSEDLNALSEEKIKPLIDLIYERVDRLTAQLDQQLPALLDNANQLTEDMQDFVQTASQLVGPENQAQIQRLLDNAARFSDDLRGTLKQADAGILAAQELLTEAKQMINPEDSKLASIMESAALSVNNLAIKLEVIGNELESASMNLNEATNEIRKDPSSLIFSRNGKVVDDEL